MDVDEETLPRNINWELARIRQYKPVARNSVRYEQSKSGKGLIHFDLKTDQLMEGEASAPILDVEPIIFHYRSPESVGREAPSVLSGRSDFPRDLHHLNPTADNRPASLCLARTGLQAVYDRQDVFGVLTRLSDWLADAKTDALHEDGWEPVPILGLEQGVLGYIDAKALQDHAAMHPKGGYAYISAGLTQENNRVFLQSGRPIIDTQNNHERNDAKHAMGDYSQSDDRFHTSIPAIFCWPPKSSVERIPRLNRWSDIAALKTGLEATGLWKHAEEAAFKLDFLFRDSSEGGIPPDMDGRRKRRAFVLIVGLWRPAPLDATIVGLSEDQDARRLEVRAYYLERPKADADRWPDNTSVREFYALTPPTPEILEIVSGEPSLPPTAILGIGALGSAFVDYAVRGGATSLSVIDDDLFLSHNLARHRGEIFDVRLSKVDVAQRLATCRAQDITVKPKMNNILSMTHSKFETILAEASLIFDATADPQVRRLLSKRAAIDRPVIRTEIFHRGRLGVSLLTRLASAQSLNCLYQQLIALAYREPSIQAWLSYEDTRDFLEDELILGFGCRSLTTKLPAYKVDVHAANAYALAKSRLEGDTLPLIGLHEIDDAGLSRGIRVIEPDPIKVFRGEEGLGDWRVLIAQNALTVMRAQRLKKAPNETGGYLYGSIDEAVQEIYIVAASPEPLGTEASPAHIELGPWKTTGFEKAFLRRTHRRLPPVGTWHSHPAGAPDASTKDWSTVNGFRQQDAQRGLPTVMAITGTTRDRVYVVEP